MHSTRRSAIDGRVKREQNTVYLNSTLYALPHRSMRVRGVPRSKKEINSAVPIRGDVHLCVDAFSAMARPSSSASILKIHPGEPLLPPLYEAVMTGMSTTGATLTGIEFIDGVAYAQSWWVRVP